MKIWPGYEVIAAMKTSRKMAPSWPVVNCTFYLLLLLFQGIFAQGPGHGAYNDTVVHLSVVEEQPSGVVVGTLPTRTGYTYSLEESSAYFELDNNNVIRTIVRIDREKLASDVISLFIAGTHPRLPLHPVDVTIFVLDINDNIPRFEESVITVPFQEQAQNGQQQLIATATDPDKGENGTILEYRIVYGNEDNQFQLISPNTETPFMFIATLSGSPPLDREVKDFYQLNISARDNGLVPNYGFCTIKINVVDINDNFPTFDPSDYVAHMKERADVGTYVIRVEATDRDIGINAQLFYSVIDSSGQFTIDERTGVMKTLTSPLQCNRLCGTSTDCNPYSCQMIVVARDGGRTPLTGRAFISVIIIDENDHDPLIIFDPSFPDPVTGYATIDENSNVLRVASISVTDEDHGDNGKTSLSIISGNEAGDFKLVTLQTFNFIQVVGPLDRETIAQYNLTLKAVDQGNPPRSSVKSLIILVNDANDHAPRFEKPEYQARISELAMPGSFVTAVKAVDEDTGQNSQLTYSIVSGNTQQWFAIDSSTGLLITQANLDHELTSQVVLNISAHDGGVTPFRNYTRLVVDIQDENDVAPVFSLSEMDVRLNENLPSNSQVVQVAAQDEDTGINGTVSYWLHPDVQLLYPGVFQVNSVSGIVTALVSLDRETLPSYVIKVVAQDGGLPPLSSTATVNLYLNDLNDNVPTLLPDIYQVSIFETDPAGIQVVRVTAVDPDAGSFGSVRYSLTTRDSNFNIDTNSGIISTTSILRRSVSTNYRLSVAATDGGGLVSSKEAVVIVTVASVADPAPVFNRQQNTFEITEDNGNQSTNIGQTVGQVQASSSGGTISYAITDGDPAQVFSINSYGSIRREKLIDHEIHPAYNLTIIATTGSKFGEQKVTVNVKDVNDNAPRFTATTSETVVMENWPVGSNIFFAKATDADSNLNAKLVYTLQSSEVTRSICAIDQNTGIISLVKTTNELASNKISLTVNVRDSGTPQLSASLNVSVRIQDVNDHTPVFPRNSYSISLSESTPVNQVIKKFEASDLDEGKNSELVYTLIRGNEDARYGMFPAGQLYIAHKLDRETRDMYSLTIQVRDSGQEPRSSTTNVTIYVLDANDNPPVFMNSTYAFSVSENRPSKSYVGSVLAVDSDLGQNAELVYTLMEGNANFTIDPISGILFTKRPFDREYVMETSSVEFYTFDVFAMDGGTPKLRGKAVVRVYIVDVNDNPPIFARGLFTASISENSANNTNVIKMTATDLDTGFNGAVTYIISDGNADKRFKVAETTGEITVAEKLDREMQDHYMLTVVATDSGSDIRLSSSAQVSITVVDYNDNAPVVTSELRQIFVQETKPPGELLATFSGSDLDQGNNAKIFFSIYSGNEDGVFNLDSYTGKLYLARPLDYENKKQYRMNITLTDAGIPSLSSSFFFSVNVTDENDNAPEFTDGFRSVNVREDVFNEPIAKLHAEDRDSGDFGRIKYSIISQDPLGNTFAIDDSGQIFVVQRLDRETVSYYKLIITATDQANPPSPRHTTQKYLTVNIQDVNDNAPVFKSPPAYKVPYRSTSGQIIGEVFADDADIGENGNVSYSLLTQTSLFSLHSTTGQLSLVQNMPSSPFFYTLRIRASDNGGWGHNNWTETSITILLFSSDPGPTFSQPSYSGQLTENDFKGTVVLNVSARPVTLSNTVEYYLIGITSDGVPRGSIFQVNPVNGVVTNTQQLDRETLGDMLTLVILAFEKGGSSPLTRDIQATVTLLDVNDSPPVFSTSVYSASPAENEEFDRTIVKVSVFDPDTTGRLQLSLSGDGSNSFTIQPNGNISSIGPLDRESRSHYKLTVRAFDGVFTSNATLSIKVTDVNDHRPVFTESFYSFTVYEDADIGATVARVTALDADEGENARVSYELFSDWGVDLFQLDSVLGTFTLVGGLDYELRQLYVLKVMAKDSGNPSLSSTVLVYMNILDVNDNQPEFDPASYSQQIFENVTVGTPVLNVSATDVDSGPNGDVRYSLVGDSNLQFTVDTVTGTIKTSMLLDREKTAMYSLVVMAIDQAEAADQRLSTTAVVDVILRDVNDCAPEFTSPSIISVKEETPNGSVVFTVLAEDQDAGMNSAVTFTLAPILDLGYPFVLEPSTGYLKVNSALRRETVANYTLVITARDGGSPPLTATQRLIVNIEDINNNAPVFDQNVYQKTVPENVSVGTSLLKVVATDDDEGMNGIVRYIILYGDESYDFSLDMASGVLRLQKSLDCERLSHYVLVIQAEDSGVEKTLSSTATVIINVTDINDFTPVFDDSPYVAYVQEGMTGTVEVTTVKARDEDSAAFSTISYVLRDTGNNVQRYFGLDPVTGKLSALETLDRETTPKFTLTIIAIDSGIPRLTGTCTVTVFVKDVNDHAPQFDSTAPYVGHVLENGGPSQSVLTVTATDLDEGINAQIMYRLVDSWGDRFAILPTTGEIVATRPLDREQQEVYNLVVIATDQGIPPMYTQCSVIIYVDDVNDNAPEFEMASYSQNITDPTNTGDFVIGVTAVDRDSNYNGKVVYTLLNAENLFHISDQTGVITAAQSLSGSGSTYTFQVLAKDLGKPTPMFRNVSVTITLQRVSGSPPVFSDFPSNLRLSENSPSGTVLTTVTAVPPRANRQYRIAGGNINSAFAINEINGTITVVGLVDYEVAPMFNLWLEARDAGVPSLSTIRPLSVTIEDVNDNLPRFDSTFYETTFMENQPVIGTSVIAVHATDADSGKNGQIEYRIVSGNQNNTFKIDNSTGVVSTQNSVIDREGIDLYLLVIEAADLGANPQKTIATLKITILDRNDNPPVFSGLFSIAIPEDIPLHSVILVLTSTDRDTPANANATYTLLPGSDSSPFAVDPFSGNVTCIKPLDAESQERYYPFVMVSDSAYQVQTQISIRLLDVNDNVPQFPKSTFAFDLQEGQPPGTSVGQLVGADRDLSSPNNEFYFSLKRPSSLFELDAEDGTITALTMMDYIQTGNGPSSLNMHTLEVLVTDLGIPSHSSQALVTITVTDANNHAPIFDQPQYISAVPENVASGTSLLTVKASDEFDFGINALIGYSVSGGNGSSLFRVAADTGVVSVSTSLSGQRGRDYTLIITAMDKGTPPLSNTTNVLLSITDINRNVPVFQNRIFQKSISENASVGYLIDTFLATDQDQGLNGQVRYFLQGGDDLFVLDAVNGRLTVNGKLDFETKTSYLLNITAKDLGLLSLSASKLYTLNLTDVNDNNPVFKQSLYNAFVKENSFIGTSVITVSATDADTGSNAVIKYSIVKDSAALSKFSINEDTGLIIVRDSLDYETRSSYTLSVMAMNPSDNSNIGLMKSVVEVRVYVTGINEFYPVFQQKEYNTVVSESAILNSTLLTLVATDRDKGVDGVIYYYLIGSSNLKGFSLDSATGALRVVERPDYESSPQITLTALAKNWGPVVGNDTDTCTINITVEDSNDPPVFTKDIYEAEILEGSRGNTPVVRVTAVDNDIKPANRMFSYTIEAGNEGTWFRIDANSGKIDTTGLGVLDRETMPEYSIRVVAVDTGTPPQTGTCTVSVRLEDVNDNGPAFDPPLLIAYVLEGQQAGTNVINLSVNTTDADGPENQGPFSYRAISGTATTYFNISQAGRVQTIKTINREENPDFKVGVVVYDSGQPQMSSTLTFTVIVSDLNNSPPQPRPLTVNVTVPNGTSAVGIVADVRPLDADLEGRYNCRIATGSKNVFNISHECDLQILVEPEMTSYTLVVEGTDGQFDYVTYVVTVNIKMYTLTTLDNAVAVLLENVPASDFLETKYGKFVGAVESIFDLSSSASVLGLNPKDNDLFVYVSVVKDRSAVPRTLLAQTLRNQKSTVERLATVKVKDSAYNLCGVNRCLNGGTCATRVVKRYGLSSSESPHFILTSASLGLNETCLCTPAYGGELCEKPQQPCGNSFCAHGGNCTGSTCTCPPEWAGNFCDQDVDECLKNPCYNGGSCYNTPGSYECICQDSYYGNQCEHIYLCVSRPCLNGGTCEDVPGGFRCRCLYGFYGELCNSSSLGFNEGSFLTLPPISDYTNIVVTGHFATTSENALLLFNPATVNSVPEGFVALEIVEGRPRFSFSLAAPSSGARPVMVEVAATAVNTGSWYRLEAKKIKQLASLVVQRCSGDGSECEQCLEQDRSCYTDVSAPPQAGDIRGASLSIGGVEDFNSVLGLSGSLRSHDFVGCAHSFLVNGHNVLNISAAINYTRLSNSCPRGQAESLCKSNTCANGGTCVDKWSQLICRCPESTTGMNCENEWQPFGFGTDAQVTFTMQEGYQRDQLLLAASGGSRHRRETGESDILLRIRTTVQNGVVFYASTVDTGCVLWIEKGLIRFAFSSVDAAIELNTNIADAEWHNITVVTAGKTVTVAVAGGSSQSRDFGKEFDFNSLQMTSMSLGGRRMLPDNRPLQGFEGCISEFRINGEKLPLNGTSERYDITSVGAVASGCAALCAGNPCGSGHACHPDGEAFTCTAVDTATSGLEPGIIVVIVFFILLLITIIIVFIIFHLRRNWFKPCLPANGDKSTHKHGGGGKLVGSENSLHSSRDSRYADNAHLEEMIIRNHIAEELAGQKTSSLTARPDLIGSNISGIPQPTLFSDGTVIIENVDHSDINHMAGLSNEDMPEHYDLENASSIAPSDSDFIQHYQRFRTELKPRVHNGLQPQRFKDNSPMNVGFKENAHQRQSPVSATGSALSAPARNSPLQVPGNAARPSSALAALNHGNYSHRDSPRVRGSPLTPFNVSHSQDSHSNSAHSLGSHHSHSSSSSNLPLPSSHPSRSLHGIKEKGRYVRGLTVDEVNRLNARPDLKSTASMLEAVSSSSDIQHPQRNRIHSPRNRLNNGHLNRLRPEEQMESNILLEPPDSSSSDSGANDSFTCSEFEYDNERNRLDLDPGGRAFSKLTEVDEGDETLVNSTGLRKDVNNSNGDSFNLSSPSDDANVGPSVNPLHPNSGVLDFDTLLNWGPNFDKLVGVFKDIALLPDTNQMLEGTTSNDYEEYV